MMLHGFVQFANHEFLLSDHLPFRKIDAGQFANALSRPYAAP